MKTKEIVIGLGGVAFVIAAAAISWKMGADSAVRNIVSNAAQIREEETGYRYIQPLLACDTLRDFESAAHAGLKDAFVQLIEEKKASGDVTDVGVYYRNLQAGQWTAVDADMPFTGASLLKLPNMMAVFREEDATGELLEKTYLADADDLPKATQLIAPSHTIQDGMTYTVDDLVRYMILYSDNRANHALDSFGADIPIGEVYSDFEVTLGTDSEGAYTITPRDYGYFFRGLYNATYLSRTLSEKALAYLAQSDFADGLRAGVPLGVPVAHKFGNATVVQDDGATLQELHDCGIVYGPVDSYLLCVMSRGRDIAQLQTVLEELSRVSYDTTQR